VFPFLKSTEKRKPQYQATVAKLPTDIPAFHAAGSRHSGEARFFNNVRAINYADRTSGVIALFDIDTFLRTFLAECLPGYGSMIIQNIIKRRADFANCVGMMIIVLPCAP
jgi:hypothetical protein